MIEIIQEQLELIAPYLVMLITFFALVKYYVYKIFGGE